MLTILRKIVKWDSLVSNSVESYPKLKLNLWEAEAAGSEVKSLPHLFSEVQGQFGL